MDSRPSAFIPKDIQTACDAKGFLRRAAQGEYRAAAPGHQAARRSKGGQPFSQLAHERAESFGRRLQPVVQASAQFHHVAGFGRATHFRAGLGRRRHGDVPKHLRRGQSHRRRNQHEIQRATQGDRLDLSPRPVHQAAGPGRRTVHHCPTRRRGRPVRPGSVPIARGHSVPASAAAASLEPPPNPAAIGIRFHKRTSAPRSRPVRRLSNSAARQIRLSGPADRSGRSHCRRIVPDGSSREQQRVVQTDGRHQGRQFVIPVRPAAQHFQKQIHFRRRPNQHAGAASPQNHGVNREVKIQAIAAVSDAHESPFSVGQGGPAVLPVPAGLHIPARTGAIIPLRKKSVKAANPLSDKAAKAAATFAIMEETAERPSERTRLQ